MPYAGSALSLLNQMGRVSKSRDYAMCGVWSPSQTLTPPLNTHVDHRKSCGRKFLIFHDKPYKSNH